ncbi:FAD-dependent monooxygenase [Microbulbifer harenosus]|uniref:2-octaprenyl-3-methyl-6-methoxy-1,4-benzoquinol hydroxylase n=1 Tax=Microbulbifer harenosus TaxID=2576840 RepID=A0ABY2UHZ4_9GAMM|nr:MULTISPECIES: FAD-dependent monooxygenase [Microbulbifer]QIL91176.1 2-octaprenyl-3-methyl-6-methoxy-1,4-benzoquinol hydroxylase [Microbulbifer sp. SH-1]TLM77379.1 2-octaprenyl-3-methyl-6-methoxy-1,4-benzoquinol hydroxylase [Microbulbifer harenosus]
MPITHTDVAIVGGGMAGACLALLFAHHCPQLRVTLLERQPLPDSSAALNLPSFDTRATAIAAGSLRIFDELGLWPQLREFAAPITRVQVSDRGHSLGASLDAGRETGASFGGMLGAVIENAALGPLLYRALGNTSTEILAPADVSSATMTAAGATLTLANRGEQLHTRLLVVADGVGSPLCRQLGIASDEVDYQQEALVTTVGLQQDHAGVAFERFTDSGPMALLPLPRRDGIHRAALVWTCERADRARLEALPEAEFIQHLQRAFGWRAGRFLRAGRIQGYPLKLSLAREQVRRGLALVGNCAHFLHPVAGQGFNLTLRDCEALARTIARTMAPQAPESGQADPGELDLLEAYWRERQHDQRLTIGFSDRIPPLFASRSLLTAGLRQAGLLGLALVPTLRTAFARQAAGLAP